MKTGRLIKDTAAYADVHPDVVRSVLQTAGEIIAATLALGEDVRLGSFGRLQMRRRIPRLRLLPDGRELQVKQRIVRLRLSRETTRSMREIIDLDPPGVRER